MTDRERREEMIADLEAASVEELYDFLAYFDEADLRWLVSCGRAMLNSADGRKESK